MATTHEIRLAARPVGVPATSDFVLASLDLPAPGDGEVLVHNKFMSVDPYMRGRMYDRPSYVPPFAIGEVLQGGAVGVVAASNSDKLKVGDVVLSMLGWREAFVTAAGALEKLDVPSGVPMEAFLGVLGMPGLTAWAGLTQIGKPKPGDVVFVSGAAGAVGSIVAQVAKLKGCTVVATAGSDEKCEWLKGLGIDHAINYRTCGNLLAAVQAAAPKGIDIYFDNVGGEHLEVAIEVARPFARLIECGMISAYNDTDPAPGPKNLIQIVGKSLTIRGFIVMEFAGLRGDFLAEVGPWIRHGKLKWQETVLEGIAEAPNAFIGLFEGKNTGKMLVKL
ncbi:NADP-dependent oxidoreductase [Sandarakinorhabdus sp.]|uniref:NADP-dependent oxidoreductase n=1 Tax=Sandarakinorhabdus sp. TaxID=1916663 RepID=UPI00333F222A